MDITTLIGAIVGVLILASGIMLRGGSFDLAQFLLFWNFSSLLITFGGAISATLINYPLKQVLGVWGIAKKVFSETPEDTTGIIGEFVGFSQRAKKEGFLALEDEVKTMTNDFMRRGVQMVVDGQDADFIRNLMETEINFVEERHKVGQEIFVALGTYSPAFGMLGTIIGLILMLAKIKSGDPMAIAAGMAVALLTTFYGIVTAYLIFLPISGKLKRRSEDELLVKQVIIRGVLLLQSGVAPSVMEANLQAYLSPKLRQMAIAKEAAARTEPAAVPEPEGPEGA